MERLEIIPLTEYARSAIEAAINYAEQLIGKAPPYDEFSAQTLYDVLLEESELDDGMLISMGVIFGELIRFKSGYEWVRVSDDFGEENALSPLGAKLVLYPISMIQKRISSKESVDISALRDGAIEYIESKLSLGNFQTR